MLSEAQFLEGLERLKERWGRIQEGCRSKWKVGSLEVIHAENEITFGSVRLRTERSPIEVRSSASAHLELDVEPDLDLESDAVKANDWLEAELSIVLHPVYCVPCPYLAGSSSSGQPVALLDEMKRLFPDVMVSLESEVEDHRVYEFGWLMPDIHPVHHTECVSLHICDLSRRMEHLLACDQVESIDSQYASKQADPWWYMLIWLSLVGRHFGLPLPASVFKSLSTA